MNGDEHPERPPHDVVEQNSGFFHPDENPASSSFLPSSLPPAPDPAPALTWTTGGLSVAHKSSGWYAALLGGSVLVAVAVYLMSRDTISSGAVVLAAVLFGAFTAKKPLPLYYSLDSNGVTVGKRQYVFEQFRSFVIVDEGTFTSILLTPLQRFAPLLPILYEPELHSQIVAILASHLPLEEHKKDAIDQITSRIKF